MDTTFAISSCALHGEDPSSDGAGRAARPGNTEGCLEDGQPDGSSGRADSAWAAYDASSAARHWAVSLATNTPVPMKPKRIITLVAIAGLLVVSVVSILPNFRHRAEWKRTVAALQSLSVERLSTAARSFARDQTAGGRQLPPEVSLRDLVRAGYLTTNDVRAFVGMEVTFSTRADDTQPQMILARARTPDGQFICLMADGSVQQFTASRLKKALENSGQAGGPANRSQPVGSERNRTSSAAGSGG